MTARYRQVHTRRGRAPLGSSPEPARRSTLAWLLLGLVVSAALALPAASAQDGAGPRIATSPVRGAPGDTVTVEADRLVAGAIYRLEVLSPSGAREMLEERASREGAVSFTLELREVGATELRLSGPDLEATLRVHALDSAPGDPTLPPDTDALPDTGIELVLEADGAALLESDGSRRWAFTRPDGSGATRAAVLHLGSAWIAHGYTVLQLDLRDGRVFHRTALSGPVLRLEPLGTGVRAEVELRVGEVTETIEHRVEEGVATPLPAFPPSLAALRWWQLEASVADPGTASQRDPTNPHLFLRVAELADDETERDAALDAALAAGGPFFELAHVARALASHGRLEAAEEVMSAALADFQARGYDAALLVDLEAHDAYGFALRPLRRALQMNDRETADFWARWLPLTAGRGLPGAADAMREYADLLREHGDSEAAADARTAAGDLAASGVRQFISDVAVNLGRGGWYAATALVVSALILHLTLLAKYWRVQSLLMRRARESGRRVGFAARLRAMRHYGTTEKLALVVLLAAAHVVAALAVWTERSDPAVRAVAAGHLSAPFVTTLLERSETSDEGHMRLLEAYRSDGAGERDAAVRQLELAVLEGVPDADLALASLRAGEGVPAPSPASLRAALGGTWASAVGSAYRDPFGYLASAAAPAALPGVSAQVLLGIFLAFAAAHLLMLFVPRPRLARNAPRTLGYHALAILVPGSGAADELWGVLLLVPWAVFGIDALAQLGWSVSPLDIPLFTGVWVMGALYAVNLVAWGVELSSYLRRMRNLRHEHPDLAQEFGMKPLRSGG